MGERNSIKNRRSFLVNLLTNTSDDAEKIRAVEDLHALEQQDEFIYKGIDGSEVTEGTPQKKGCGCLGVVAVGVLGMLPVVEQVAQMF